MQTITEDLLAVLRQRRSAGESVKTMAVEVGVTWQKLDKAIRNGIRRGANRKTTSSGAQASEAVRRDLGEVIRPGLMTERYRPRRLLDLVGQKDVMEHLCMFAAKPFEAAFIFEGATGTGKTSAAFALAADLGCDMDASPREFGGVNVIASGEQTADTIRDIYNRMSQRPFSGSGWKVLIVNEADRMSTAVETIWLDRLENLPRWTAIVFTTNYASKLSDRFLDRCQRVRFESDARKLKLPAYGLLGDIWRKETGADPDMTVISHVVEEATRDGHLSFRRAVGLLTPLLKSKGGGQ